MRLVSSRCIDEIYADLGISKPMATEIMPQDPKAMLQKLHTTMELGENNLQKEVKDDPGKLNQALEEELPIKASMSGKLNQGLADAEDYPFIGDSPPKLQDVAFERAPGGIRNIGLTPCPWCVHPHLDHMQGRH